MVFRVCQLFFDHDCDSELAELGRTAAAAAATTIAAGRRRTVLEVFRDDVFDKVRVMAKGVFWVSSVRRCQPK